MANAKDYLISMEGGHDTSTKGKETPYIKDLGRKIKENEFNDAVIEYLKEDLERCGFRTLDVSPEKGTDTPLKTRTDRANKAKADLHISIHFNAFDGTFSGANPEGHSIHIYPGSKESRKAAEFIYKYLIQGTDQKHRGIKENNFHMLRETDMPAILSENGFMDNPREALLMLNVDFQKEVAREHAQGICDYFEVKYIEEPKKSSGSSEGKLYRVQTGAFKNKSNAIDLENQLLKDDFKTYMVKADGLYKVQTGAFADKDNANELIKTLESKGYHTYITTESGEPVTDKTVESKPKVPAKPKANLRVDGYWGSSTTKALQRYFGTIIDGRLSNPSLVIKKIQRAVGTRVDGLLGRETITKMQKHMNTPQDGKVSKPSMMVKELQRRLNKGEF